MGKTHCKHHVKYTVTEYSIILNWGHNEIFFLTNNDNAYLHSRRRARWGSAPRAPACPLASSSALGSGRTHVSGRPARSAASCASLWNVGSGTRPGHTRTHSSCHSVGYTCSGFWRHFDCTSILCVRDGRRVIHGGDGEVKGCLVQFIWR